ncbi:DUF3598 family protein [Leptolyngbya sp. NK1-12]|uniref:DUF3598 family protein n=1 Tax=Leptolyngbya sp. NK1-12 TaxID=2547451 RepID=A0AA96WJJ5_9CYAN|nr:DUF3598 family protein [Leptolyngbya sp. NK1-12]WNZ22526.1 DUF3598 family protein [Leptolyngbya sp. NK1-12]
MTDLGASSQWSNLLQNLGAWQGSFTQISPDGTIEADSPSLVTLAGLNDNRTVRQTIQKFSSTGAVIYDRVLEYSSLNRGVLVFENGAFSQGSIQYGPFSEFGAELGFIDGDRRLRVVQLFDKASQLAKITLIREQRQDTPIAESLPPIQSLTPEQLVGEWQGESVTLYPDWRNPARYSTRLSVRLEGNQLHQSISAPGIELTSTAQVDGPILRFQQGRYPVQVLLLPDGASATTPLTVPRGQSFFLEAGWLLHPNRRQRMIRSYDARGEWVSLTLVTEQKISS